MEQKQVFPTRGKRTANNFLNNYKIPTLIGIGVNGLVSLLILALLILILPGLLLKSLSIIVALMIFISIFFLITKREYATQLPIIEFQWLMFKKKIGKTIYHNNLKTLKKTTSLTNIEGTFEKIKLYNSRKATILSAKKIKKYKGDKNV